MAVATDHPAISRGTRPWGKAAPTRVRLRAQFFRAGRTARQRIISARSALLTVTGFGWIDAAAWHTLGAGAGFLLVGLSFLALEFLSREGAA